MVDTSQSPALGYREVTRCCYPSPYHSGAHSGVHSRVASLENVASHSVVNYSLHFVDPATGTHTQNIESYWDRVKRFKYMKGCHAIELPSYLDKFMWQEQFGATDRAEHLQAYCHYLSSLTFDFHRSCPSGNIIPEFLLTFVFIFLSNSTVSNFYPSDLILLVMIFPMTWFCLRNIHVTSI